MKPQPVSRPAVIFLLAAILLLDSAVAARAHSTKGRIKIPLEKTDIGVDDVAYFVESYVHRELYKHRFVQSKRRFYVKEFLRVDHDGPRADIHFIVLDVKEKTTFPDVMTIRRGSDGIWHYRTKNTTAPLEVYTYVMKWGYYYQRYVLPISAAGVGLAIFFLAMLRLHKRKKGASRCDA
jgi:hypothetical protein